MKETERINRRIIMIMEEFKKYLSKEHHFLSSYEFVTFSKLQAMCLRKGISVSGYLSFCDLKRNLMEDIPLEYELEDLIAVHEIIRREKNITRETVRRRMMMDKGNFDRFFSKKRGQKTTNMKRIEDLCNSIEMTLPDFMERVKRHVMEKMITAEG